MNISDIWQEVYNILKASPSNAVGFNIHIKGAVPISMNENTFTISVPMEINKNMITFRYKESIESALEQVTGSKLALSIILDSDISFENPPEDAIINPTDEDNPSHTVNSKYTFENFVVGASNEYAYSMALDATRNPEFPNPLFLYGNSGLGKTHLMHAIGNRILDFNPLAEVMYVTSEEFTNQFIKSIREKKIDEFRNKFRSVDALLVDDIQFIETKDATQEEFFHTFNSLNNSNKLIVLTSDRKPTEILTLSARLRTRFNGGLPIDIQAPNYETRVAILQKKAILHKAEISDEVLEYIADKIKSSVRELEGILIKMISIAQIHKKEYNKELADYVIKSFLPNDGIIKITPERIIDKVCTFYNVSKSEILGQSRVKNIVIPRQVGMYLCSKLTSLNYVVIGNEFGNKDRTTVTHNIEKIENEMKTNYELDMQIKQIINDLNNITL